MHVIVDVVQRYADLFDGLQAGIGILPGLHGDVFDLFQLLGDVDQVVLAGFQVARQIGSVERVQAGGQASFDHQLFVLVHVLQRNVHVFAGLFQQTRQAIDQRITIQVAARGLAETGIDFLEIGLHDVQHFIQLPSHLA